VLSELTEEELDDVVGAKGKWNRDRTAVRHGHEDGESEVQLQTNEHFADRDSLARVVLERMLAGVSTRRYRRTQEPVGEEVEVTARSTSSPRYRARSWSAPATRSLS
jgi:putative transposase